MLRAVLIVIVIVLGLGLLGWVVFDVRDRSMSVEVRTDKIRSDTERVVDSTRELVDRAENGVRRDAPTTQPIP